jgi:hypothetical protein
VSKIHRTSNVLKFLVLIHSPGNKYKDAPPNTLDLFKQCHYNKKKAFTLAVQSTIVSKLSISSQTNDRLNWYASIHEPCNVACTARLKWRWRLLNLLSMAVNRSLWMMLFLKFLLTKPRKTNFSWMWGSKAYLVVPVLEVNESYKQNWCRRSRH